MNASEMRQLNAEELKARITEWQEALFRMRCNQSIGQTTNVSAIGDMRRQIARAMTIINEMERNAASQG